MLAITARDRKKLQKQEDEKNQHRERRQLELQARRQKRDAEYETFRLACDAVGLPMKLIQELLYQALDTPEKIYTFILNRSALFNASANCKCGKGKDESAI